MTYLFRILILTLFMIMGAACGNPPAAPAILTVAPMARAPDEASGVAEAIATPEQTAQADDTLRTVLQQTLALWTTAYQERDAGLLRQAIDPKNYRLRTSLTQHLQWATHDEPATEGATTPAVTRTWTVELQEFVQRPNGFVIAQANVDGTSRTFTFKELQGRWLLAEPNKEDLGTTTTLKQGQFSITHYAWDADVVGQVAAVLQKVHTELSTKLGRGPTEEINVQLVPLSNLVPATIIQGNNFRYIGSDGTRYRPDKKDLVVISPNSWDFFQGITTSTWEAQLTSLLAYEYVNLINDCCFAPLDKQTFWMIDGLTGYVNLNDQASVYSETIRTALAANRLLPIRAANAQGNATAADLHSRSQYYQDFETYQLAQAESVLLVEYLVRQHGGFEGYRKLIADYATSQNIAESAQRVLGISVQELDKQWQTDLQQRFGG